MTLKYYFKMFNANSKLSEFNFKGVEVEEPPWSLLCSQAGWGWGPSDKKVREQ